MFNVGEKVLLDGVVPCKVHGYYEAQGSYFVVVDITGKLAQAVWGTITEVEQGTAEKLRHVSFSLMLVHPENLTKA